MIRWLSIALAILPLLASADGAIFPPPDYIVYETDQTAAIFYEPDTTTETLVVSISYQGDAEDFAWIIPTPSKPEISRGSRTLFSAIEEDIIGYDSYYDYFYGSEGIGASAPLEEEKTVTVIEEKAVEYYDVTILEATSATDLVDWLNDNGYQFPETSTYVLSDYVSEGWFFTALRINDTALGDTNVETNLATGQAVPVQFTFSTDNVVYPLRISGVTSSTVTADEVFPTIAPLSQSITLYVFSDHKVEATRFYQSFGDWVKRKDIENLATDVNGNPWVSPEKRKYFLTKLTATLTTADMTDDIFPKQAEDDDEIGSDYYGTDWNAEEVATVIIISLIIPALAILSITFSPLGFLEIATCIVRAKAKSTRWKIAAHVVQWLNLFPVLILTVLLIIMTWDMFFNDFAYNWKYSYDKTEIGGAIGVVLAILLVNLVFIAIPIVQTILLRRKRHALPD